MTPMEFCIRRFIDLLSHGKYSLYEPQEMGDETKGYFQKILNEFLDPLSIQSCTISPSKPEEPKAS